MREARQTVLAYGTTGVRGAPVASRLLDAGYRLRVLVRDAAKATALAAAGAEIFEGDLAEPESLARASAGADAVYLHMPLVYDRPRAAAFVRNVLAAAEAGGVQRIVFQGNARFPAEPTEVAGFEIDRDAVTAVHASALASVVLRPTVYMDNFAGPWTAPAIVGEGVVAYPIPAEARTAFVSADDAAALAVAAIGRADLDGATFDLAGPEVLTGNDVARVSRPHLAARCATKQSRSIGSRRASCRPSARRRHGRSSPCTAGTRSEATAAATRSTRLPPWRRCRRG